ncbi:MAG TPA: TIGR00269 family protein [Peptococcaceae bacterium]|nr:TIGR00269 family protein [Peptococcaceae bacterium]
MKCTVCKREAFVKLPAHNAKFCPDHFDQFFLRQVSRLIKKFRMLRPGARVLVAVSGGKDSLTVVDVLHRLGYQVTGFHVNVGIKENNFSEESEAVTISFFEKLGLPLKIINLEKEYGRNITTFARRFPRLCAVCGLTKRHLMNDYALAGRFSCVATGHHLDDLASSLLANVLRWDLSYLAKNLPVLPAEGPFAKKIKPLALLSEEEVRIYSELRGIKPVTAVCPYSKEAKFKRYKFFLNELEKQSPGMKRAFYENYLKVAGIFEKAGTSELPLRNCKICGGPTPSEICTFCRLWNRTQSAQEEDQEINLGDGN